MSLPRPINWLRDGTGEDAQKVLDAAEEVKAALELAQEKLVTLEEENNEEAARLQATLQENLNAVMDSVSGVPRNLFIVSTSFPFIPADNEDIPDEIKMLSFSSTPFPVPELATLYARNVMDVIVAMLNAGVIPTMTPEQIEDTPGDVLFHATLNDPETNEVKGHIKAKFWQYNPQANRPEDVEGTGDWI